MPSITLSKKELLASVGKKMKNEELKERISMLGTDLEGIEGDEVKVEVFPNRPDMLSQQGFNRALASFMGTKVGLSKYHVEKSGQKVIVEKSVAECRPYTACAIVRNLSFDSQQLKEIIEVQEKLHTTFGRNRRRMAIGIYPLENITFPIRFTGMKPEEIKFRPLEAPGEMTARQVLEEHTKGKEFAHLLTGLKRYACFLDSKGKVMSLTPIINSHLAGRVTEKTKDVFVECSGFDLRVQQEGLNMLVTTLADMGGKVESLILEYPNKKVVTPNLEPWTMKADPTYIGQLLGIDLKERDLKALLARMGYGYDKGMALVPAYRTDILHQADLAEDTAIAYGYENIPEIIPKIATLGSGKKFGTFCDKVREVLVGHGLIETKSFNLIGAETQGVRMRTKTERVTVLNPVSEEYDSLRSSLMPSLLETLQRNQRHEYPQRIFEIGRVFTATKHVAEGTHLSVALSGEDVTYTTIRQLLDDLLFSLGWEANYAVAAHPSFIEGRTARVKIEGKEVALIGETHPEVLASFGQTMPTAIFELDLDVVFSLL